MYKKYKLTCWSDDFEVEADLTQASAPIKVDGEATQYQTADCRHRLSELLTLAACWSYRDTPDSNIDFSVIATLVEIE